MGFFGGGRGGCCLHKFLVRISAATPREDLEANHLLRKTEDVHGTGRIQKVSENESFLFILETLNLGVFLQDRSKRSSAIKPEIALTEKIRNTLLILRMH